MDESIITDRRNKEIVLTPTLELTGTSIPNGRSKELRRIEWDIIKRLLVLLHNEDKLKKTHIAMKCNMSYDKCIMYINWLELMELINKEKTDEGFEVISLQERGKRILNTVLKNNIISQNQLFYM